MLDFTDGLILYHGSYCEVKKSLLERCARRKDFGQGFYLTTSKDQSIRFLKTSIAKAFANGSIKENQDYGYLSIFQLRPSPDYPHMHLMMQMWNGCTVLRLIEKDFCFWMLKMLWQNMILLLGKLRMMRQMQRWPHT